MRQRQLHRSRVLEIYILFCYVFVRCMSSYLFSFDRVHEPKNEYIGKNIILNEIFTTDHAIHQSSEGI